MVLRIGVGVLLVASVSTASAQGVAARSVRVGTDQARVMSRPSVKSEVLLAPASGTSLETLDKLNDWYWVLIARDVHGTQRAGWIHESALEGYVAPVDPEKLRDEEPGQEQDPKRAENQEEEDGREGQQEQIAGIAAGIVALPEVPLHEALAKSEEPKKVDVRRLRKMEQEIEKARQSLERLQHSS